MSFDRNGAIEKFLKRKLGKIDMHSVDDPLVLDMLVAAMKNKTDDDIKGYLERGEE